MHRVIRVWYAKMGCRMVVDMVRGYVVGEAVVLYGVQE